MTWRGPLALPSMLVRCYCWYGSGFTVYYQLCENERLRWPCRARVTALPVGSSVCRLQMAIAGCLNETANNDLLALRDMLFQSELLASSESTLANNNRYCQLCITCVNG